MNQYRTCLSNCKFIKPVIECVKDVKYICIGLKKTCLGVLDRGNRDKNNKTVLEEGGGIEMSTTVLPFAMLAPSLKYSPRVKWNWLPDFCM